MSELVPLVWEFPAFPPAGLEGPLGLGSCESDVGRGAAVGGGGLVGIGATVGSAAGENAPQARLTLTRMAIKTNNIRYCDFISFSPYLLCVKILARIHHKFIKWKVHRSWLHGC